MKNEYIGSLDQGTSSTRFLLFDINDFKIIAKHQIAIDSIFPNEGWVEQDPFHILKSSTDCLIACLQKFQNLGFDVNDIKAIGITNQRETSVLWDKNTGLPLYNAIVWQDNRTAKLLEHIIHEENGFESTNQDPTASLNCIKHICGLPVSTYFSAGKIRWILDNVEGAQKAIEENTCLFGTVDTWIVWNWSKMFGHSTLHITDVTNASRTMLMNIETLDWDPYLCKFFGIPMNILPEIRSSSEIYCQLNIPQFKLNIPLCGILGDQQAALMGMKCIYPGTLKNTYGTGCFILCNTGNKLIHSQHGLLSTVAHKLGPSAKAHYALEGSVAIAGAAVNWLKHSLGLITQDSDMENLAKTVSDTAGVYFVPAFSGLYAPYWDTSARGIICGLTHATTKAHIVRSTLEAISFQTKEIIDAITLDTQEFFSQNDACFKSMHVDGGMATNDTLMQIQSDIAGIEILRHNMLENTALGAAMVAAHAIKLINLTIPEKPLTNNVMTNGCKTNDIVDQTENLTSFKPQISELERSERFIRWKKAIRRALWWDSLDDIYHDEAVHEGHKKRRETLKNNLS